jgi:anaphase-promoting complex subunit 1
LNNIGIEFWINNSIAFRSNNTEMLHILELPTTIILLDSIRPDVLLYRALGRCLIMWDNIVPTSEWLQNQIPPAILNSLFLDKSRGRKNDNILGKFFNSKTRSYLEPRSAFSLYLSSIAGFCYGIGIVFAGTSDPIAKKTLLEKLSFLQR